MTVSRQRRRAALLGNGVRRCFWCGEAFDGDTTDPLARRAATLEHLVPKGHYLNGLLRFATRVTTAPKATVLACRGCNAERGKGRPGPWDEFMPTLEGYLLRQLELSMMVRPVNRAGWFRAVHEAVNQSSSIV